MSSTLEMDGEVKQENGFFSTSRTVNQKHQRSKCARKTAIKSWWFRFVYLSALTLLRNLFWSFWLYIKLFYFVYFLVLWYISVRYKSINERVRFVKCCAGTYAYRTTITSTSCSACACRTVVTSSVIFYCSRTSKSFEIT